VRLGQIPGEVAGAETDTRPILGEVIAELMACRNHLRHQLLPSPHSFCDQEKSGASAMTPQLSQNQRGRGRIRAIVQGQRNQPGL